MVGTAVLDAVTGVPVVVRVAVLDFVHRAVVSLQVAVGVLGGMREKDTADVNVGVWEGDTDVVIEAEGVTVPAADGEGVFVIVGVGESAVGDVDALPVTEAERVVEAAVDADAARLNVAVADKVVDPVAAPLLEGDALTDNVGGLLELPLLDASLVALTELLTVAVGDGCAVEEATDDALPLVEPLAVGAAVGVVEMAVLADTAADTEALTDRVAVTSMDADAVKDAEPVTLCDSVA